MASENLHAPRERLRPETIAQHQAIVSLMEELEAIDWYSQRADDCDDPALKEILLHNMREEVEHASMLLEWLRRTGAEFSRQFDIHLYSRGDIAAKEVEVGHGPDASGPAAPSPAPPRFTVGAMKDAGGAPWTR
jgi:uncharacterized protein